MNAADVFGALSFLVTLIALLYPNIRQNLGTWGRAIVLSFGVFGVANWMLLKKYPNFYDIAANYIAENKTTFLLIMVYVALVIYTELRIRYRRS